MKVTIILLMFSQCIFGIQVLKKPYYDPTRAEEYFEQFMKTHEKNYENDEHKQAKFEIFKQNLIAINVRNKEEPLAVFDITKYSDLTKEEFLSKRTGLKLGALDDKCKILHNSDVTTNDAPDEFDWRSKDVVTPAKDQQDCGSCWAFSVTGNVEGQYAIKSGKLVSLSEQELVDCDKGSKGCEGGDLTKAISSLIDNGGQESENDYPYEDKDDTCRVDSSKVIAKVVGCNAYNLTDEEKSKEALFKNGPFAIGIDSTDVHDYHKGILKNCRFTALDHAVLLVGYGTENGIPYWIVKNSWGSQWGEKGFFRIKRGVNSCGYLNYYHVSAVL